MVVYKLEISQSCLSSEVRKRYEYCLKIIKRLGSYQVNQTLDSQDVAMKSDSSPVSVIDVNSERMFRDAISLEFVLDSVQGEELGGSQLSDFNWVIDPIDGTRKFIRGIPTWGISIALEYQSKVVAAAISLPANGDIWSAIYQGGAFKNNKKIQVSNISDVKESYITTSARKYFLEIGEHVCYDHVHSCSLHDPGFLDVYSFAMLCDGRIDGIVSCQDNWWDIAAATLILSESGGCYSFSSNESRPNNGVNFFTNGKIHNQLSSMIN